MSKKDEKGLIDQIREINEKERVAEHEAERKAFEKRREAEHIQQEQYSKRLQQEKIELMRLKQGVIEQPELVMKEEKVKKVYTPKEKISNFFYHNKMWVIICTCVVVVSGFLLYDYLTTVRPDSTVLILANNYNLSLHTTEMEDLLEKYSSDLNGDGKVSVSVVYSPVSSTEKMKIDNQTYTANMTRLMSELQSGECMLIIADNKTTEQVGLGDVLEDLTSRYSGKKNVNKSGILLNQTKLGEKINCNDIPDDLFIGVRQVTSGTLYEKEMQKNYDEAISELDKFMKELG